MPENKKPKQTEKHTTGPVPLAIIGIGCMFPKAGDPTSYWTNIRDGVDCISDVPDTHWNPSDYYNGDASTPDMTYAQRGGFIDAIDFDPLLYGLSPNNIEATDTTQLLGMAVARQALLDAGYSTNQDSKDGKPFDRNRTSVILGVTGTLELVIPLGARLGHPLWRKALTESGVDENIIEEVIQRISDGYVPWQENSFPGLLGNVAAGRIANRFDLGGTNCVVDAACASSLSAVHMAAMELYSGRSDMAITGGFDTFNDIFMYMCFSKTPALSPTGDCRPFSHNGDGTILGEGLGAIIIKRLDDAKRDNDKIYAVLRGIGSSSDGRGNAIYAPSAEGQTRALKDAYTETGVSPRTIELVEAHGTGTKVGDAVEAKALASVYREDRNEGTWCALGSVKSMIGHTKAAAGIAGLIKIIMALQHKVIPPTIKVDKPLDLLEPGLAPIYVNTKKRPWIAKPDNPRRAAISAFGFGGSNFHCVVEEAETEKPDIEWDGNVLIIAISAKSTKEIENQLNKIDLSTNWESLRLAAAQSLKTFQMKLSCRLILVISKQTNLDKLISNCRTLLVQNKKLSHWMTADGAYYGSGKSPGKLAMLFPGQGSQYPNMLVDLACQFPQMQNVLYQADCTFSSEPTDNRLSDLIYPIPKFTDKAQALDVEKLQATENTQPAIGAVSLGVLRIFEHFTVHPDTTAGHSFGELTALCVARRIDEESLHKLAGKRGSLMQANQGDRGSMLAVHASAAVLHEIMEGEQLDLIIANHNAPSQVVLSGATGQIKRAEDVLDKRGIKAKRLAVSAAFHSSFVNDAKKSFSEFTKSTKFKNSKVAVFANTSAEPYPADTNKAKYLLAEQLAQPVEFVRQIENMYAAGIHTFVETGPGNVLAGLVQSILKNKAHTVISVDSSKGNRNGQHDLALVLARLSSLGYQVDLSKWDSSYLANYVQTPLVKPGLTIKLNGANYVKPKKNIKAARGAGKINKQAVIQNTTANKINDLSQVSQLSASKQQQFKGQLPNNPDTVQGLLQSTQQSILALQKMQEQTAELHRQYLLSQETAQQTINNLLLEQQQIFTATVPSKHEDPSAINQKIVEQPVVRSEISHTAQQPTEAINTVDAVSQPPSLANEQLETILMEVVSDKTGYPAEMLSMDMSLDTDLGIDSIKRVEILSGLQEKLPGLQTIQPEDLGTFQLLKHIVEFMVVSADTENTSTSDQQSTPSVHADNTNKQVILEIVAEKTGYPAEMIDINMNLDTDLGIDSIKRVEILSAFQEKMTNAPVVNPEDLANLQTLGQIIDFMDNGSTTVEKETLSPTEPKQQTGQYTDVLMQVVADKTGYPAEMLNLDMNLDTDLGIDSIKRVEILSGFQELLPDAPAVNPEDLASLQTLRQIVDFMHGNTTLSTGYKKTDPIPTIIQPPAGSNLWRGVVTLAPCDRTDQREQISISNKLIVGITDDGSDLPHHLSESLLKCGAQTKIISLHDNIDTALTGLVIIAPENPGSSFNRDAFQLIQGIGKSIKNKGGLLASISRLGGNFGIDHLSSADPISGGIAGLIKTASREWNKANCKVIDIDTSTDDLNGLSDSIAEELFLKGPIEVGIHGQLRVTPVVIPTPLTDSKLSASPLSSGDIVVISGGARGITAEIAYQLARTYKTEVVLLGRTAAPKPEPKWLKELQNETEIKKAIISNSPVELTPKQVGEAFREWMSNREVQHNIERIQAEGIKASYYAVDIRDRQQLKDIFTEIRKSSGPISGLVHGAGVLADKAIEDKSTDQFDLVYSTKVYGLNSMLAASEDDDLKLLLVFSSSTARYGRIGQVDYASANEVLNKIAQQQQRLRSQCRVLSINWGPWDGGMVTPQLKKLFESEGVGVIPLNSGSNYLVQEICSNGPVEIVVLGSAPADDLCQVHSQIEENENPTMHTAFERAVTVEDHPLLVSHVMKGSAVLPAALIVEWMAHGALHNNPGLIFIGLNDLQMFKGVSLGADDRIVLQINTSEIQTAQGNDHVVVELRSKDYLHASANILLGSNYSEHEPVSINTSSSLHPYKGDDVYSTGRLFHGKEMQGIETVIGCTDTEIIAKVKSAPVPAQWMKRPVRSKWLSDPLIIDTSFQLMILWTFEYLGTGSLPTRIGTYRQFQRSFPKNGATISLRILDKFSHSVTANIEFLDDGGKMIAQIENYECVTDASLNEAFIDNCLLKEPQA